MLKLLIKIFKLHLTKKPLLHDQPQCDGHGGEEEKENEHAHRHQRDSMLRVRPVAVQLNFSVKVEKYLYHITIAKISKIFEIST